MSLLLLIFLIILIVIAWPVLRSIMAFWHLRRQMREMYRQATGQDPRQGAYQRQRASASKGDTQRSSRGGWTYPRRRKRKVITRDMGEYVKWEDVPVDPSQPPSTSSYTSSTVESQVEDAEWEEIKN